MKFPDADLLIGLAKLMLSPVLTRAAALTRVWAVIKFESPSSSASSPNSPQRFEASNNA